jgi:hypothetical protein
MVGSPSDRSVACADAPGRWRSYADEKPESAGWFEWSLPWRKSEDIRIRFVAENRKRTAGFKDIISPSFDHWDGYRVLLPDGLLWRDHERQDYEAYGNYSVALVGVEDVAPCPFCGGKPNLRGIRKSMSGGVIMPSYPHEWNTWYLKCCRWIHGPHFSSPVAVTTEWNDRLKAARSASEEAQRSEASQHQQGEKT